MCFVFERAGLLGKYRKEKKGGSDFRKGEIGQSPIKR